MSMSTNVTGVRDLDGQFAKMMAVKLACEAAATEYPQQVIKYFGTPDESREWLQREMSEVDISKAISRPEAESSDIWEVDLSKLPKEVKLIRFTNSY